MEDRKENKGTVYSCQYKEMKGNTTEWWPSHKDSVTGDKTQTTGARRRGLPAEDMWLSSHKANISFRFVQQ